MTTTAALRDTFLDLTPDEVSVFANLLASHLLTTDTVTFARTLDEAKAIA